MRFDFVGLALLEIDPPAIGFHPGDARAEMLVRISNPFVIGFAVFILFSVRVRVSTMPKDVNELLALFIGLQLVPRISLLRCNDRFYIVYPLLKSLRGLRPDLVWLVLRISTRRIFLRQSRGN